MSDYLAYVIAILVLVLAFNTIIDDGVDTSDTSVKDKIEIIEKAKNTDDPLIKEQGAIAKAELIEIQQKKALEAEKQKEDKTQANTKEPFLDNPINAIFLVFGILIVFIIGFSALKSFFRGRN